MPNMKENPNTSSYTGSLSNVTWKAAPKATFAKQEHLPAACLRLLNKARQMGIVSISVELPEASSSVRSQSACSANWSCWRLSSSAPPRKPVLTPVWFRSHRSHSGGSPAPHPGQIPLCGHRLGYTIYQTALLQARQEFPGKMTFIPLVGISDENNPYLQSNVIVDRFAEKFQAKSYYTSVPAYLKRGGPRMSIEEDRYSRLKQQWEKLDAAIVGLGPRFSRGDFLISEASEEYKRLIASSQTVGDILANFFYKDGSVLDSSGFYEQVSLPLARLKGIRNWFASLEAHLCCPCDSGAARLHQDPHHR